MLEFTFSRPAPNTAANRLCRNGNLANILIGNSDDIREIYLVTLPNDTTRWHIVKANGNIEVASNENCS